MQRERDSDNSDDASHDAQIIHLRLACLRTERFESKNILMQLFRHWGIKGICFNGWVEIREYLEESLL